MFCFIKNGRFFQFKFGELIYKKILKNKAYDGNF